MGSNDAGEMLAAAKAEVVRLEADLAEQVRINAEDRRALQNAIDVGNATKAERDRLREQLGGRELSLALATRNVSYYEAATRNLTDENARLREQIGKVRECAEADYKCPCCTGYEHILSILADVPESQHQTEAPDAGEFAEALAKAWDEGAIAASGLYAARTLVPGATAPKNPYRTEQGEHDE